MSYMPDIGSPPPVGDSSSPPPSDSKPPPPSDGKPPPPSDGKPPPPSDGKPPPPSDGKPPPPSDGKQPDGKQPDGKQPDGKPNPGDLKTSDTGRPDQGEQGKEKGPCYPNNTCNKGLKCYSGICVKIPADAFVPPPSNTRPEEGCSCSTTSAPLPIYTLVLLALGILWRRRRRS